MKNKKNNGFGLLSVIIIIIITAIVSALATGIIVTSNSDGINITNYDLKDDKNLQEFIDLYKTILSKYYDDIDKEGMIKAAEEGMLNFLGDKYTTILSDSDYSTMMDGLKDEYEGIGITIEGNIIRDVTANSPAERAGLLINDEIVTINNTNVQNLSSSEISNLIKNNNVDTVSLVIRRNGELINYTIKKSNLAYPYAEGEIIDNTTIGYLKISAFSEKLADQVEKEVTKLENNNINGLIIDLRNNGGGYLSAANETASIFLKKGLTIYSLTTNSNTTTIKDETDEYKEYRLVVLVNKQTASAAEILAAALKQSYGATLVGTQTYGKGKVQQISSLKSGETVKYTTAKWLTPSGVCIDGVGLNVDYNLDLVYNYNENNEIIGYEDTQLNKAIELLS